MDGSEHPATVSEDSLVTVVEDGPVKTVIRARGSHVNVAGDHLFDFDLRLTAYRGKSMLRGEYTLRNASRRSPEHVRHRGVRLRLETGLADGLRFRYPRHDEPFHVEGELAPGDESYYYMAYNGSKQEGALTIRRDWPNEGWVPPIEYDWSSRRYVEEGYRVVKNGQALVPQTASSEYNDIGYVGLSDSRGAGVTATIHFGSRYWPISYAANGDGSVEVGLFSDKTDYRFTVPYHTHETREFTLDFHDRSTSAYARAFQQTYPLAARVTDLEYVNECRVLSDKLVSIEDVNRFFDENDLDIRMGRNNESFYMVRYWDASQGGGNNQFDITYHNLVRFWRTGDSGAYLKAKSWADYRADQAVIHTDDWTYAPDHSDRFPQFHVHNGSEFLTTNGNFFDNQHRHTRGLPLMYYMTGNDRYLEAFLEDSEVVTFNDRVRLQYLNTRVQSVLIRLGMHAYRVLGEVAPIVSIQERSGFDREELHQGIRAYLRAVLDARYDFSRACAGPGQPKGWSDEPGSSVHDPRRFWFAGGDRERNREPKFHVFSMFPDMMWNYAFHADADDPNLQELALRVLDLEHYIWSYLFTHCDEERERASIGDFYVYLFDEECRPVPVQQCVEGDDFHPGYQIETFAYLLSGDPAHLERGVAFAKAQHYNGDQLQWSNAYRTGFQNFVYHWLRGEPDRQPPVLSDVRAVKVEDLPVVVKWTTDEPASGQVVYWSNRSDRRITPIESTEERVHVVPLDDLAQMQTYKYRVASRDRSGNWNLSTRREVLLDDFSVNTLPRYRRELRGGARLGHDGAERAIRFEGAEGSLARFGFEPEVQSPRGHLSFELALDERFGSGASLSIALIQDAQNFYELSALDARERTNGVRLRKVVGGRVVEQTTLRRNPFAREELRAKIVFHPLGVEVEEGVTGETAEIRTPQAERVEIRSVAFVLRGVGGRLDNLLFETQ
jgi:hypothetical protein